MTTVGGVVHTGPLPKFICASYGFRRFWEDLGEYRHWSNKNCQEPSQREFKQAVDRVRLTSSAHRVSPTLLVCCMDFYDPDKDSRHLGTHFRNMRAIACDKHFRAIACQLRDFLRTSRWPREPGQVVMLLFWCRSGNHRSVSTCELVYYCLQRAGFPVAPPDHMARAHWWRKCGNRGPCALCDPKRLPNTRWEAQNRAALEEAFKVYQEVDGPCVETSAETSACPLVS